MTTTLNLTTATPADIDTAWAEAVAPILADMERTSFGISRRSAQLAKLASTADTRVELIEQLQSEVESLESRNEMNRDERAVVEAPFSAEWSTRGGWTRAYKVQGGHVHSSTNCSSCHNGESLTELYWVTELSGFDAKEIADMAGEAACTLCYPNAPVKPTSIFTPAERATQAERDERAAKTAAKRADRDAKSITDVDGKPLRDNNGSTIATEHTARIELTNMIHSVMEMHGPYYIGRETASLESKTHWAHMAIDYGQTADRLAAAIAAKTGETIEEVVDTHQLKADKKWAKSLKDWAKSPYNPANA